MQRKTGMKTLTLLAALLCAAPLVAHADDPKAKEHAKSEPLTAADALVVARLHRANQTEIEMANIARERGTSAVETFARTLLHDHMAADKALAALGKRHGLYPIPSPDDTDTGDADNIARLKLLRGANLDREFIDMMVVDHRDALSMVDTAISEVAEPELRQLLTTTRPVLQRHFDTARAMQTKAPQASL